MFKQYFFNRTKRLQQLTALAAVVLVAGIGTYLLISSHAASPYASTTADSGTVANGAITQSCLGASDGTCVVFENTTSTSSVILGVNDGGGWGATTAATLTNAGIKWDRIEFDMPNMTANYQGAAGDTAYGFSDVAILNVSDQTALSTVNPTDYANWALSVIKANPSINLWEVGNEMYYKGCNSAGTDCIADPVSYGAMYLALYNAVQSAGLGSKVTLLFNMFGDYYNSNTDTWSQDAGGGGWLHDAVSANAGTSYSTSLANAIEHEAFSMHPYGGVAISDYGQDEVSPYALMGGPVSGDSNYYASTYCPSGCSDQQMATDWLGPTFGTGTIPPIYVTEYGIQVSEVGTSSSPVSDSGYNTPCSTQQEGQAYLLTEAYNIFLSDSHVKGIWWYQTEDDGTGQWGLLNSDNSTRPSFNALTEELDLKQHTPSCTPS